MHEKIFIKQKISLVLFGVFLCLILLEIGLRMGGFIILSLREHKNRLALREKETFPIMCLGGSTTACCGENSYPAQLEEVLNKRNIGIRFNVINKGIEGMNSAGILSQLEKNLDMYNPDMVISMIGANDGGDTIPYEVSLKAKLNLLIKGFRTYKLVKLLWLHIVNKVEELKSYEPKEKKGQIVIEAGHSGEDNDLMDMHMIYMTQKNMKKQKKL